MSDEANQGAASPPPPLPPDSGTVDAARPCITCGYNLIGLHLDGNCPECGTSVQQSLRGILLRYASLEYLQTLRLGASMAIWGMIATIIISVASIFVPVVAVYFMGGFSQAIMQAIPAVASLACSLAVAYGHYQLTAPDPGYTGIEPPNSARQVARISSIAVIIFEIVMIAAGLLSASAAGVGAFGVAGPLDPLPVMIGIAWIGGFAAWATRFFAMMLYIRWLATRIPDATMMGQTRTYIWLLPLITVLLGCLLFLGPLIATIIYCVMLSRLRWHVNRFIHDRNPATT